MKKMLKPAAIIVATIALVFSIQSCNTSKPIEQSSLEGYWILKSLNGEEAKEAFKGKIPSLQFDFTNNSVAGNGGCNSFGGEFTLSETGIFSAPNLFATQMACFQENKEPEFLKALSTPDLTILFNENGELIFKKDDTVILEFVKGEAPSENNITAISSESLTGIWNLTSIADGDMDKLFVEKKPTMEFAEDNKVFGYAGCNTYRTSYELNGDTITFKPVASTMMACPSLQGETLFTGLLTTPLQAMINGDKLIFSKEGNTVLEFTKDTENK